MSRTQSHKVKVGNKAMMALLLCLGQHEALSGPQWFKGWRVPFLDDIYIATAPDRCKTR